MRRLLCLIILFAPWLAHAQVQLQVNSTLVDTMTLANGRYDADWPGLPDTLDIRDGAGDRLFLVNNSGGIIAIDSLRHFDLKPSHPDHPGQITLKTWEPIYRNFIKGAVAVGDDTIAVNNQSSYQVGDYLWFRTTGEIMLVNEVLETGSPDSLVVARAQLGTTAGTYAIDELKPAEITTIADGASLELTGDWIPAYAGTTYVSVRVHYRTSSGPATTECTIRALAEGGVGNFSASWVRLDSVDNTGTDTLSANVVVHNTGTDSIQIIRAEALPNYASRFSGTPDTILVAAGEADTLTVRFHPSPADSAGAHLGYLWVHFREWGQKYNTYGRHKIKVEGVVRPGGATKRLIVMAADTSITTDHRFVSTFSEIDSVVHYLGTGPAATAEGPLRGERRWGVTVAADATTRFTYTAPDTSSVPGGLMPGMRYWIHEVGWDGGAIVDHRYGYAETIGRPGNPVEVPLEDDFRFAYMAGTDMVAVIKTNKKVHTHSYNEIDDEHGSDDGDDRDVKQILGDEGAAWQADTWHVARGTGDEITVNAVHRRSIPVGRVYEVAQGDSGLPRYGPAGAQVGTKNWAGATQEQHGMVDHRLFLELAEVVGSTPTFLEIWHESDGGRRWMAHDPLHQLSRLIKYNQWGYFPKSLIKRAYATHHLGDGDSLLMAKIPTTATFLALPEDPTQPPTVVASGVAVTERIHTGATDAIADEVGAGVKEIDLAALPPSETARYAVSLDGVGASGGFPVSNSSVWHLWFHYLRGYTNHRFGMPDSLKYTDFGGHIAGIPHTHIFLGNKVGAPTRGFFQGPQDRGDTDEAVALGQTVIAVSDTSDMAVGDTLLVDEGTELWAIIGFPSASQIEVDRHVCGSTETTHPIDARLREPRASLCPDAKLVITGPHGYDDAADFDEPFTSHIRAYAALLRAYEMKAVAFIDSQLAFYETGNGIPDALDEALVGIFGLVALQVTDAGHPEYGGIHWGIETSGHPSGMRFGFQDIQSQLPRHYWRFQVNYAGTMRAVGLLSLASRLVYPFDAALADTFATRAELAYDYMLNRSPVAVDSLTLGPWVLGQSERLARMRVRDEADTTAVKTAIEAAWTHWDGQAAEPGFFNAYIDDRVPNSDYDEVGTVSDPGQEAEWHYWLGYLAAGDTSSTIWKETLAELKARTGVVQADVFEGESIRRTSQDRTGAETGAMLKGDYEPLTLMLMEKYHDSAMTTAEEDTVKTIISLTIDSMLGANGQGWSYIPGMGPFSVPATLQRIRLWNRVHGTFRLFGMPIYADNNADREDGATLNISRLRYPYTWNNFAADYPQRLRYIPHTGHVLMSEFDIENMAPAVVALAALLPDAVGRPRPEWKAGGATHLAPYSTGAIFSSLDEDPPTITWTPRRIAEVGALYSHTLTATDANPPITCTKLSGPANFSVDLNSCAMTYTPSTSEMDTSFTMQVQVKDALNNATVLNWPLFVPSSVTRAYVDFDGTAGNHMATPDPGISAQTMDIRFEVAADDWSAGVDQGIVWQPNGFSVHINEDGHITFKPYNGTSWPASAITTVPIATTDGQLVRGRVVYFGGALFFYTRSDPNIERATGWSFVEMVNGTSEPINDSTDSLYVGRSNIGGGNLPWLGKVFQVVVFNGSGGPVVAHFDGRNTGRLNASARTMTDYLGNVWQMRGTAFRHTARYYIALNGNDGNDGWGKGTPWGTSSALTSNTFLPGAQVLVRAGDTLTGGLSIPAHVKVTRYNTGRPTATNP